MRDYRNNRKVCILCGAQIEHCGNRTKYCRRCAAVRFAEQNRLYKRLRREQAAAEAAAALAALLPRPRYQPAVSIDAVVRAAMAEGLSYGKYCQRHGL